MTTSQTLESSPRKPLRLWPGIVAALLLLLVRFALPIVWADGQILAVIGSLLIAVAVFVWWLFFSRAPWLERLGVILLMAVALLATRFIVHESIRGGMMGMMLVVYAIPGLSVALVAWAAVSRRLTAAPRLAALLAATLIACGMWTLLRTDGIRGDGSSQLAWRWTPTSEDRLLAQANDTPPTPAPTPAATASPVDKPAELAATPAVASSPKELLANPADNAVPIPSPSTAAKLNVSWSGFRGSRRDSVIRGVKIETDWSKTPPVALWRRPIGPGWSSFAVRGDLVYTQEQRGDDELVACYRLTTGEPVWKHRDAARFWESNAGAGPRGTPTLSGGRVYTLGATGIVNVLDADNGAVIWSRNASKDTGAKLPGWGFSSSPLVVNDVVIVAASGALVAYDLATGNPRWVGKVGGGSYSSPHLVTIDGVAQILQLNGDGLTGIAPGDGSPLWTHAWEGVPIIQPALVAGGDVLISTGGTSGSLGMRRVAVEHGPEGWHAEERWTSTSLKPYFNDFVVHKGYAFGFDGFILACIDVADGKRKWKGGRYGNGQLVLLPDQDLLLVVSEEGELALVGATADKFTELARFPAIEGKTWNHPVLVDDVVLVRNGQEMAAFRLSLASR